MKSNQESPLQFASLSIGANYFTISAGEIVECVKVDEYNGRKVNGRKGKVNHWLNKNVFTTADEAQDYLDYLLECGRQIALERNQDGGK